MRRRFSEAGLIPAGVLAAAAAGGLGSMIVGVVLAATGDVAPAAPYLVSGTTVSAAVGVVIWVSRKVVNGELVPRPVKEELDAARAAADRVEQIALRMEQRDIKQLSVIERSNEALFATRDLAKDLQRENARLGGVGVTARPPTPIT